MHLVISKRDLFFFWKLHFVKVSTIHLFFHFDNIVKIIVNALNFLEVYFFPLSNFSALILLFVSFSTVALKFLKASRVWSFNFWNFAQVLLLVINEGNEIVCPAQGFDFQRSTNVIMYGIKCFFWSPIMFFKNKF